MAPLTEFHKPGDLITFTVGASVVGDGLIVEFSGNRTCVVAAADSKKCAGVAVYGGAVGDKIAVATDGIWPLLASGNIAAGAQVVAAASGAVKAATIEMGGAYSATEIENAFSVIGRAYEAITSGQRGRVKLEL